MADTLHTFPSPLHQRLFTQGLGRPTQFSHGATAEEVHAFIAAPLEDPLARQYAIELAHHYRDLLPKGSFGQPGLGLVITVPEERQDQVELDHVGYQEQVDSITPVTTCIKNPEIIEIFRVHPSAPVTSQSQTGYEAFLTFSVFLVFVGCYADIHHLPKLKLQMEIVPPGMKDRWLHLFSKAKAVFTRKKQMTNLEYRREHEALATEMRSLRRDFPNAIEEISEKSLINVNPRKMLDCTEREVQDYLRSRTLTLVASPTERAIIGYLAPSLPSQPLIEDPIVMIPYKLLLPEEDPLLARAIEIGNQLKTRSPVTLELTIEEGTPTSLLFQNEDKKSTYRVLLPVDDLAQISTGQALRVTKGDITTVYTIGKRRQGSLVLLDHGRAVGSLEIQGSHLNLELTKAGVVLSGTIVPKKSLCAVEILGKTIFALVLTLESLAERLQEPWQAHSLRQIARQIQMQEGQSFVTTGGLFRIRYSPASQSWAIACESPLIEAAGSFKRSEGFLVMGARGDCG
ncbi:MAG: hypothetical protein HY073_00030 [Deltaproteobacteria bacterium]|nr:hypothetical protein [Deltaproteobacteria bacterium]